MPPFVVKLVAAGRMTTQNLSRKKICLYVGGMVDCFDTVTNFVGFKTSSSC